MTISSSAPDSALEKFIGELSDRSSLWYDLRVTEMSGYDYVFAPDAVCRQLSNLKAISHFFNQLQTILGSPSARTVLVSYWHDRYREQHFEKFTISWSGNIPSDWQRDLLDGSPQLDFIRMLYDHSEQLIVEDY
jgi:hypothetical protein